jgi:hypothetical protein
MAVLMFPSERIGRSRGDLRRPTVPRPGRAPGRPRHARTTRWPWRFEDQASSEAPPQTAEAQGSLRNAVSGQAHAGTRGQDRLTAASPLRLVRPVLASVVPPKMAGQDPACKCGAGLQLRYARIKLRTSVRACGTEEPARPPVTWSLSSFASRMPPSARYPRQTGYPVRQVPGRAWAERIPRDREALSPGVANTPGKRGQRYIAAQRFTQTPKSLHPGRAGHPPAGNASP